MDPGVISAPAPKRKTGKGGEENHIYWSGIDCDPSGVDAPEFRFDGCAWNRVACAGDSSGERMS